MTNQQLFSLTTDIGILMVLVGIIIYCTYRYLKTLPETFKLLKENSKLKKELIETLRKEKNGKN